MKPLKRTVRKRRPPSGERLFIGLVTAACLLALTAKPAAAYIDPGTGSMIVQAVIAVIAAAGVALTTFRERIAAFISRLFGGDRNKKG